MTQNTGISSDNSDVSDDDLSSASGGLDAMMLDENVIKNSVAGLHSGNFQGMKVDPSKADLQIGIPKDASDNLLGSDPRTWGPQ